MTGLAYEQVLPPPRCSVGLNGALWLLAAWLLLSHCVPVLEEDDPDRTRRERRRPATEKPVSTPTLQDLGISAAGWQSKEEALQKEESALLQDFGKTMASFQASTPTAIKEGSVSAQRALSFVPVSNEELSAWVEARLKDEEPPPFPQKNRTELITEEKETADRFYESLQKALPEIDDSSLVQLRFKMTLALAAAHMQKGHLDSKQGIPLEVLEHAEKKAREMRNLINQELSKRGLREK